MRFIIYGAGGIGCVVGGHLFRKNYDVVLVGNAQHVDAINAHGLKLVTGDETLVLKVPAVKTANELAPFREDDVVMLCEIATHCQVFGTIEECRRAAHLADLLRAEFDHERATRDAHV